MKTCSQCNIALSLDCFDNQSTGKDGKRADCKVCRKRFIQSKYGLVKQCYSQQVAKAKKREYAAPNYSENALLDWANNSPEFHELYIAWQESGYKSNFKPSFDRVNDYISYTLDNLQVVTWTENNDKGKSAKLNGTNNKNNLAVDMLDLNGIFIKRFYSVSEAARNFGGIPSNIVGAINNRVSKKREANGNIRLITITTAYGHKWRYSSVPNNNSEIT